MDAVDAVKANAVNSIGQNVGSLINLAITRVVDAVMSPSKDDQRKEMHEFYDRMREIANSSNYVRESNPFQIASPREKIMQELDTVDSLVVQSIDSLKKARDMSRCGVCRHDLDTTAKMVEKSVKPVFDATDKVRAMQVLKENGKLAQGQTWESLKREERKMVMDVTQQIKSQRDSKSEYGGVIGIGRENKKQDGEEEEDFIQLAAPKKPKRAKAKRAKPKRAKQAKRR